MIWRIRSRRTFAELRSHGLRARNGAVRMSYVPVPTEHPQVAFAFSRRFGNAVERNRARRRLRAAFVATWQAEPGPTGAYQLTGSRRLLDEDFAKIAAAVDRCVQQIAAAGPVPSAAVPPREGASA